MLFQVFSCLLLPLAAFVPGSAQVDSANLNFNLNSTTDIPDLSSTEQSTTEWNSSVHVDITKTEISVIELRRACDGWQMADLFVELKVADATYNTSVDYQCGDNLVNCEWTDVFSIDSAVDRMMVRVFRLDDDNELLGYRRLSLYWLIQANGLSVDTDDTYTMEIDNWDAAYDCSMRLEFSVRYYGVEKDDGGNNDSGNGGVSDWAIVGIVVGCVAFLVLLPFIHKRSMKTHAEVLRKRTAIRERRRRHRQWTGEEAGMLTFGELFWYGIARTFIAAGCSPNCKCDDGDGGRNCECAHECVALCERDGGGGRECECGGGGGGVFNCDADCNCDGDCNCDCDGCGDIGAGANCVIM